MEIAQLACELHLLLLLKVMGAHIGLRRLIGTPKVSITGKGQNMKSRRVITLAFATIVFMVFVVGLQPGVMGVPVYESYTLQDDDLGGDANNDNTVNVLDLNILKRSYGKSKGQPGYDGRADFNNSTTVNILDLNILKNNYGKKRNPPPPVNTPEPQTMVMVGSLVTGLLGVLRMRRRFIIRGGIGINGFKVVGKAERKEEEDV
jgi:hypothetical protein